MIEITVQQGNFKRSVRSTHPDDRKQFREVLETFARLARQRGFVLRCEPQTQANGGGPITDIVLVHRTSDFAQYGGTR